MFYVSMTNCFGLNFAYNANNCLRGDVLVVYCDLFKGQRIHEEDVGWPLSLGSGDHVGRTWGNRCRYHVRRGCSDRWGRGVEITWIGRVLVGLAVSDSGHPRLQKSFRQHYSVRLLLTLEDRRTMSKQSLWIKVTISISDDQSSTNIYLYHLQSPINFY